MLSVTLKSPDIELLTKITPQILKESDEFGLDAQAELKAALEKLTIVCFLGSKKKKNNEPESSEVVRYTAVKAYDAAAIGITNSFASPTKEDIVKDATTGEKQVFTPTFGNVVDEIAASQDDAQPFERFVPAKRNIAFVSGAGTSDDTAQASHPESTAGAAVMELATAKDDVGSPLKKPKDKIKQN